MNEPDGEYSTESGTAAGNVTTNLCPGNGRKWKILYGKITLTNDATVATRILWLNITNSGATNIHSIGYSANVTASQTLDLEIHGAMLAAANFTYGTSASTVNANVFIGNNYWVCDTDRFTIQVQNGVAGDSYTWYIKVIELPD